jgi:hypothetical protein
VTKNSELSQIEQGIPAGQFEEAMQNRNFEMEFRVGLSVDEAPHGELISFGGTGGVPPEPEQVKPIQQYYSLPAQLGAGRVSASDGGRGGLLRLFERELRGDQSGGWEKDHCYLGADPAFVRELLANGVLGASGVVGDVVQLEGERGQLMWLVLAQEECPVIVFSK